MLGLLLVDHGSRQADANDQLLDMAARVQRLRPNDLVASCHMEIAQPDIAGGFAGLIARGATHIVVMPYLLAAGRHLSRDVPRLVAEAAAAHPRVTYAIGAALGPHDRLAELLI